MKNTYCRQKYLFELDYSTTAFSPVILRETDIELIQNYDEPYNLYDYNLVYRRKLSTDILDEDADTIEKFESISAKVSDVDELVLIDTRMYCDNPILRNYAEDTLKAYVCLFKKGGIDNITIAKIADNTVDIISGAINASPA